MRVIQRMRFRYAIKEVRIVNNKEKFVFTDLETQDPDEANGLIRIHRLNYPDVRCFLVRAKLPWNGRDVPVLV